ncbi:MAG TPA: 6-bladed beta-propeller, partial [Gemmatimonadales bacterium]|nr:6-bladed beta-propeller [Gemmatimonadales bacterium]
MRLTMVGTALLLAACANDSTPESLVTIDTLPGGIPRVISSAPVDSGHWSLVHLHDIQPGEGEPGELGQPSDVALGDDGRLYVVESSPIGIMVFDSDGKYLRTIGRSGGGPGEFNSAFVAVRGDTLAVQDPSQSRGTTIDLRNDSVISIVSTSCCYWYPI